jgi:hypothetical protein
VAAPGGGERNKSVLGAVDDRVKVANVKLDGRRRGRGLDLGLDTRLLRDEASERLEVAAAIVVLGSERARGEVLEG